MELTEQYLDSLTLIADFWIANKENSIQSIANQGITIKKNKIYFKKYDISIIMESSHFGEIELFAEGWQKKHPKVVLTKANKRVEAYELHFQKTRQVGNKMVLEFIGELIK